MSVENKNNFERKKKRLKILFLTIWLVYLLSPFDLIPERFSPGLGFIDDLLLGGFLYILYYQHTLPRKNTDSKVEEVSDLREAGRPGNESD